MYLVDFIDGVFGQWKSNLQTTTPDIKSEAGSAVQYLGLGFMSNSSCSLVRNLEVWYSTDVLHHYCLYISAVVLCVLINKSTLCLLIVVVFCIRFGFLFVFVCFSMCVCVLLHFCILPTVINRVWGQLNRPRHPVSTSKWWVQILLMALTFAHTHIHTLRMWMNFTAGKDSTHLGCCLCFVKKCSLYHLWW